MEIHKEIQISVISEEIIHQMKWFSLWTLTSIQWILLELKISPFFSVFVVTITFHKYTSEFDIISWICKHFGTFNYSSYFLVKCFVFDWFDIERKTIFGTFEKLGCLSSYYFVQHIKILTEFNTCNVLKWSDFTNYPIIFSSLMIRKLRIFWEGNWMNEFTSTPSVRTYFSNTFEVLLQVYYFFLVRYSCSPILSERKYRDNNNRYWIQETFSISHKHNLKIFFHMLGLIEYEWK